MEKEFIRAPCRGVSAGLVRNVEWTGCAELGQQQASWRDHWRQAIRLDGLPGAQHAHACVSVVFSDKGFRNRVHREWGGSCTWPAALVLSLESPLLGLVKSGRGYEGWYAPSSQNTWS